jgi:flagellar biosynthesis protein FliR
MNISDQQLLAYVTALLWPLFRISAIFIAVPVFSLSIVPVRVRVMLGFVMTMLIAPVLPPMPKIDPFSFPGLMIGAQQIVIGITSGFVLQMVFSVMLMAGQAIAYSMGLGFASMVDPSTGVQVPVIAQVFVISGSLLFLAVDGHLLLIEMLAHSFTTLPVGEIALERDQMWQLALWGGQIISGGVLLSLPIMSALLLVNLSFGVASKVAPQLQIFGVGFPVSITLGMILVWIGISSMLDAFSGMLQHGFELISHLLRIS